MKNKRLFSCILAAAVLLGQALFFSPAALAENAGSPADYPFNKEGLWLTEIYQNDVDRSAKNDSRQEKGYDAIRLYDSKADIMEFIEVTSTHAEPILLNDLYELYYEGTPLAITDMNGSPDVTITKGQSVVIWNVRSDIAGIPTEDEFRSEMRVPDDALVLKTVCGINWAASSSFSIRSKADGALISTFTANELNTHDGFSVELMIPDIGPEMQVYREMTLPSAGYVYSVQLNGLVQARTPEASTSKGVYLTELRPNDLDRSAVYGLPNEMMECFEIVNTTDKAVDLNGEYQLYYAVKEGAKKPLPLYHYASDAGNMSSEGCTVKAGGTAVIWCYNKAFLTGYTEFPSEADFRETYGISDNVPVYIFTNLSGMSNRNRGVEIYRGLADGSRELVSSYTYIGASDCRNNRSAVLAVNPEGPEMLLLTPNATSTIGRVSSSQYTYVRDDGSALVLKLKDTVPESITQGQELRVSFYYKATGALPRTGITTCYRFDGAGSWHTNTEIKQRVPELYEALISADELFSHEYVEFYVSADNRYRSTLSPMYRVQITQLNDVEGIRTNISDGDEIGGTVSVTANDGGNNAQSEIYIDGKKLSVSPMLEDGAYFTFHADGRDSSFKSAVTTAENELIAAIGKWQYTILDGQAIHIDNHYFTYNEERDSYDTTLRFWAGTYGTTVDDYLLPSANREDFTVTQLALRLAGSKVYYPTMIGPDDSATGAKTNLSTKHSAIHNIGDGSGCCPYMDVSFSVPASEATAVGALLDTTKLSDGEHTLLVTNGVSRQTVRFIVDNKAPEIDLGITAGSELGCTASIDPQIKETFTLKKFSVTLDGQAIETPFRGALEKGEHILSAYAEDLAGNVTTKTAAFSVSDAAFILSGAGAADITDSGAKLYLSLQSASDAEAAFYKAEKIGTSKIETKMAAGILPYIQYTIDVGSVSAQARILADWDGKSSGSDGTHASTMYVLNTVTGKWDEVAAADENGSIRNASFTAKDHIKDGKATVIIQCTADSALPQLDTVTDGRKDDGMSWTGNTVPQDYDFCFAWMTDTQRYTEQWPQHFINMNRWLVDNADKLRIEYLIHTGDIIDDCDMLYEWENADKAMRILDEAGLPYGILGGNHDVAAGLARYDNYSAYFGEERFLSQPTYGGSYRNNSGHYDLISAKGQDFIIVYMSWNVYQDEIDWLNSVLQQYGDRKAILCFHTYTRAKYNGSGLLDYFGQILQKEVVAKNPNVFAVLNGHYSGSSYETAMFDDDGDGVNDRAVYQICTDYQSYAEGGSEYIKFLYFDLDNNRIYMNSYSPYLNDFNVYENAEVEILNREGARAINVDKMVLDVEFDTSEQSILENSFSAYVFTNELLGTAQLDKDSGEAAIELNGLKSGTEYSWYAVVTNADGAELKTGVYTFTTEGKANSASDPSGGNSGTSSPFTGDIRADLFLALAGVSAVSLYAVIALRKKR